MLSLEVINATEMHCNLYCIFVVSSVMSLFYFPFHLLQMEPFVALFSAKVMPLKTLSCWMRSPGILLSPQSADLRDHSVSQLVQHLTHLMFFFLKICPDSWICIFAIIYKKTPLTQQRRQNRYLCSSLCS